MTTTETLQWTKDCKHSIRFDAPKSVSQPAVRTLYVAKSFFKGRVPAKISITVSTIPNGETQ